MAIDLSAFDDNKVLEEFSTFQKQQEGGLDLSAFDTVDLSAFDQPEQEKSVMQDVGEQALAGPAKGVINTAQTLNSVIDYTIAKPYQYLKSVFGGDWEDVWLKDIIDPQKTEALKQALPEAQTTAGKVVGVAGQVMVPYLGFSKAASAVGIANNLLKSYAAGALTDLSVFDANDKNLSSMLAESESPVLNNMVTRALASDKDDTKLMAGIKNAAEGLIIGPTVDVFMESVKLAKAGYIARRNMQHAEKMKPYMEEAVNRYREMNLSPEEAVRRAANALKVNKIDFVPTEELAVAAKELANDDLMFKASEVGLDVSKLVDKKATKTVGKAILKEAKETYGLSSGETAELFINFDKHVAKAKAQASPVRTVGQVAADNAKAEWASKSAIQRAEQMDMFTGGTTGLNQYLEEGVKPTSLPHQVDMFDLLGYPKTAPASTAKTGMLGKPVVEKAAHRPTYTMDQVDMLLSGGKGERQLPSVITRGAVERNIDAIVKADRKLNFLRTEKVAKLVDKEIARRAVRTENRFVSTDFPARLLLGVRERISQISPRIGHALNEFERVVHERMHVARQRVVPLNRAIRTLSATDRNTFKQLWLNEDSKGLQQFVASRPMIADAMASVRGLLDDFAADGIRTGALEGTRSGYLPRLVIDHKGLLKAVGYEKRSLIEKELMDTANRLGRSLDTLERTDIINKHLRSKIPETMRAGRTSASKERVIEKIPQELSKYYADPLESIGHYINTMSDNISKREFLGYTSTNAGLKDENTLRASIGAKLDAEVQAGKMNAGDVEEVVKLLHARLGPGEQASARVLQNAKNFMYMGLLGNPISAITQLGDVALAAHINGIGNTIQGLVKTISRKGLTKEDLGIAQNTIDMMNPLRSHRWLDTVMRTSGFQMADNLGKATTINGSLAKYRKLSMTATGEKAIMKQYADAFTPQELSAALDALRTNKITPQVKYMLWNDLTKMQPISMSEMPEMYLRNPNGRVFYALKTFTIKQLNRMYFDGVDAIRKGHYKDGSMQLMKFAGLLTAGGMTTDALKDVIQRREQVDIEDRVIANMYKIAGTSEYIADKVAKGDIREAAIASIAPPLLPFSEAAYQDILGALDPDKDFEGIFAMSSMNYVPWVGRVFHQWFGGGAEAYNERINKEKE